MEGGGGGSEHPGDATHRCHGFEDVDPYVSIMANAQGCQILTR